MTGMFLPTLNAALNATSAGLLVLGFRAIRRKQVAVHRRYMLAACAVSALFLLSYVTYHARVGSVHYRGIGGLRVVYFAILATHTALAIAIVPLAGRTVWLARRQRIAEHRYLARWTLPLWLYVSVTGVVVYWMLYQRP